MMKADMEKMKKAIGVLDLMRVDSVKYLATKDQYRVTYRDENDMKKTMMINGMDYW